MNKTCFCPVILTILDGWGHSEQTEGNAIKLATTPTMNKIYQKYSHTLLNASGIYVGLPNQQMGNSEVGHTTIGAGRTINQDLVRISKSIEDKTFFGNETLHQICMNTHSNNSQLHIIGLCSDGGVHSHIDHLIALINLVKEYKVQTCIHIITDGRDTQPNTSKTFIERINKIIDNIDNINICTISGRYYSMDRDCRWSRTEKAYKILTENTINMTENSNAVDIINHSYQQGIFDEFITPTRISSGSICDNDSIIFFNFRPDRIRQLLYCFKDQEFKGFTTKTINNLNIVTFTQYDTNLSVPLVFPPQKHHNFLGEILASYGLKQFRIAETEKYAHVTYFFNGGIEEPFPGEDRELIPSPKVDTYDLAPKMSAHQLTDSIIQAMNKNYYDFIVINYANPDMVGHTGNLDATITAVSAIDKCIRRLLEYINQNSGTLIITADHGNADYMLDINNKPCTSHSTNPVPFIIINEKLKNNLKLRSKGRLADIAPTILDLFNIDIPNDMDGRSLIYNNINHITK